MNCFSKISEQKLQKIKNKNYKDPGTKSTKIWEQKLQKSGKQKVTKIWEQKLQKTGKQITKIWEQKLQKKLKIQEQK
jgi:hypothetical protein